MNDVFTIKTFDKESRARTGILETARGTIATPTFIPSGFGAALIPLTPDDLQSHGCQMIAGSACHLFLYPRQEFIGNMGGLHKFLGWNGPILTDGGGLRGFSSHAGNGKVSLAGHAHTHAGAVPSIAKVTENSVLVRSPLDGDYKLMTPEGMIETQHLFGADILLCFDVSSSLEVGYEATAVHAERMHRWAIRCLENHLLIKSAQKQHGAPSSALFGVIQGSPYEDLIQESAEFHTSIPLDGLCIGGLAGTSKAEMHDLLDMTIPYLPKQLPRYAAGLNNVPDVLAAIAMGVDMFDSISLMKLAHSGTALVREPENHWQLSLHNTALAKEDSPIQEECICSTCRRFSRAYMHHLFRSDELLGVRLVSLHNSVFLMSLLDEVRSHIQAGRFGAWCKRWMGAG